MESCPASDEAHHGRCGLPTGLNRPSATGGKAVGDGALISPGRQILGLFLRVVINVVR
jgi:transcription initiation factor TFIID subunit TAF12